VSPPSVDAWVWMMNAKKKGTSMYDPILFTVSEALRDLGATVAFVSERNRGDMLRAVEAKVASGRTPLIFEVALHWAKPEWREDLRRLSDLGAFIVHYQTEPVWQTAKLESVVPDIKPTEIWDYSRKNLDWYPESARPLYRYVPPGYAKDLDFGINVTKHRSERKIGFIGEMRHRPEERVVYEQVFGGDLVSSNRVWTKEQYIHFLEERPVQLNIHKNENCCPSTNPVEAFRMAQIISNRACVISAPSDPRDEEEWQGIVHFANVSQMGRLLDEISEDVGGCQTKSFKEFERRFKPARILKRSGFLDAWWPPRVVVPLRAS